MKNLKELTKAERFDLQLESDFDEALEDEDFKKLIKSLNRSKKEMMKYTSRLKNTCQEIKNCRNCQGLFQCQNGLEGHIDTPKIEENRLYFTYYPCKYYQKMVLKDNESNRLKKVMLKDIDLKLNDKKQSKVIKWLDTFYDHFDLGKIQKGLYLHGNFGSGKTFLTSAFLHELEEKKNIHVEIIYITDLIRDLKDDFFEFADKMDWYCKVEVLMLDDLGAEKVTDWVRDEVLGPLLQYRMSQGKTTFFTSNLTIEELEEHFSLTKSSEDRVKARRLIERIKYLTVDMELVSESRREKRGIHE
ncbi:MAG: ATP-binding protein [Bacilli bacterium]|nr:ATP-binding protein [Bacilli bacterium]